MAEEAATTTAETTTAADTIGTIGIAMIGIATIAAETVDTTEDRQTTTEEVIAMTTTAEAVATEETFGGIDRRVVIGEGLRGEGTIAAAAVPEAGRLHAEIIAGTTEEATPEVLPGGTTIMVGVATRTISGVGLPKCTAETIAEETIVEEMIAGIAVRAFCAKVFLEMCIFWKKAGLIYEYNHYFHSLLN